MQDIRETLLQQSEQAYKNKDYKTAISTLLDMVKAGYASGQILCNLGAFICPYFSVAKCRKRIPRSN